MTKKNLLTKIVLALIIVLSFFNVNPVAAIPVTGDAADNTVIPVTALPTLTSFVDRLPAPINSSASGLAGLYVQDKFALSIMQQPAGSPGFISEQNDVVTQFAMASQYGTTGLLAHNYLAGAYFSQIEMGQTIVLVNNDKSLAYYKVEKIESFQALQPTSPYSDFRVLDGSDRVLTATEMFTNIYMQSGKLVLQTCIEEAGDLSWGRLFITATPIDSPLF